MFLRGCSLGYPITLDCVGDAPERCSKIPRIAEKKIHSSLQVQEEIHSRLDVTKTYVLHPMQTKTTIEPE